MIPYVSHIEWAVADGQALVDFLTASFAWEFSNWSEHYWLYEPGQGVAVGVLETAAAEIERQGLSFIKTADLSAICEKMLALGGKLKEPVTDIPNYGRYAKIIEPQGNVIGLFESVEAV